jgi:hypothetical protein
MEEKLREQALAAFNTVQAREKKLSEADCLQKIEDIASALKELAGATAGMGLELAPADSNLLLRDEPRLYPDARHYVVRSTLASEPGTGTILCGVWSIPEAGVLEFYTNPEHPVRESQPLNGNEAALFAPVLEHIRGVSHGTSLWSKRDVPAISRILSGPSGK